MIDQSLGLNRRRDDIGEVKTEDLELDRVGMDENDISQYYVTISIHTDSSNTAVSKGKSSLGVIICGSGNGAAMTANKHEKVRAALCWNKETVNLARLHNNANILSIPARFITIPEALSMVKIFIETKFEGGRHQARIDKIPCN